MAYNKGKMVLAIVVIALAMSSMVVVVLSTPTANAQIRVKPSCSNNPGYSHGEPTHSCGPLRAR